MNLILDLFNWAVRNNHTRLVQRLLRLPYIRDNADVSGNYALRRAAANVNPHIFRMLLQLPNVQSDMHSLESLLSWTAGFGMAELVEILLEFQQLRTNTRALTVALHWTINVGNVAIVRRLLEEQNLRDNLTSFDLHNAMRQGHVEIAFILLQEPAIRNGNNLEVSFVIAIENGYTEIIMSLMELESIRQNAHYQHNAALLTALNAHNLMLVQMLLNLPNVILHLDDGAIVSRLLQLPELSCDYVQVFHNMLRCNQYDAVARLLHMPHVFNTALAHNFYLTSGLFTGATACSALMQLMNNIKHQVHGVCQIPDLYMINIRAETLYELMNKHSMALESLPAWYIDESWRIIDAVGNFLCGNESAAWELLNYEFIVDYYRNAAHMFSAFMLMVSPKFTASSPRQLLIARYLLIVTWAKPDSIEFMFAICGLENAAGDLPILTPDLAQVTFNQDYYCYAPLGASEYDDAYDIMSNYYR